MSVSNGFYRVCGKCVQHLHVCDLGDDQAVEVLVDSGQTGCVTLMVGDAEGYGEAMFATNGAVTILRDTTNGDICDADTDGKLCIFNDDGSVTIKNRLGATKKISFNAMSSV